MISPSVRKWIFYVTILTGLPLFTLAQELTTDEHTLLLLHFNDTLIGEDGETPLTAEGIQFEPGVWGDGVYLGDGNRLFYAGRQNIDPQSGTVEFWIKPRWVHENGSNNYFLRLGLEGGILMGKDGGNFWRAIFNRFSAGGNPEQGTGCYTTHKWQAEQWHHSAFTWDENHISLFMDGILCSQQPVTAALPMVKDTLLQLGADGAGGFLDGVVDEFRISNVARSPEDIYQSFWQGVKHRIQLVDLKLSPVYMALAREKVLPLTLTATDSNDCTYSVARFAQFILSDADICSIDDRGVLKALRAGTTTITAQVENLFSNPITVEVIERWNAPDSFRCTPFYTSVLLQWQPDSLGNAVAYHLYRSRSSTSFSEPVRYLGPNGYYTDYHLQGGTTYYYTISSVDRYGNESQRSPVIEVATQNDPSLFTRIANLDVLIPIYTADMMQDEARRIQNGVELARTFYFRNSKGQLNLDMTYLLIDAAAPSSEGASYANIEADLRERGVKDNQYDGVHTLAHNLYGCFGGFIILGNTGASYGRICGVWYPGSDPEVDYTACWVFTHEFGHVLDGVFAYLSGYPDMLFNHFPWAYPLPPGIDTFDAGNHYDGMAKLLRLFEHHLDYAAPWDGYIEVVDADGDGLADDDFRVPVDEKRFGSDSNLPDSDRDGLSDLDEFIAGIYNSSDPQNEDSDGDGLKDGDDIYPLSSFPGTITWMETIPTLDGRLSTDEGWTLMSDSLLFCSIPGLQLSMYSNWDDDYLYFAFKSNMKLKLFLGLDGSGADGTHTCPYKFPQGDYESGDRGINERSYGDTYNEDSYLVVRYDSSRVYLRKTAVEGSWAAADMDSGLFCIEVRIPHAIGPGRAWHYVAADAPVLQQQHFDPYDVIGLELLARRLEGAVDLEPLDWVTMEWASMFELYNFLDALLLPHGAQTPVVAQGTGSPEGYRLQQNYPNPFNPETILSFSLSKPVDVRLTIYDRRGCKVRTLLQQKLDAGQHSCVWNGKDDSGQLVSSGVYFYRLQGAGFSLVKKMILVR